MTRLKGSCARIGGALTPVDTAVLRALVGTGGMRPVDLKRRTGKADHTLYQSLHYLEGLGKVEKVTAPKRSVVWRLI